MTIIKKQLGLPLPFFARPALSWRPKRGAKQYYRAVKSVTLWQFKRYLFGGGRASNKKENGERGRKGFWDVTLLLSLAVLYSDDLVFVVCLFVCLFVYCYLRFGDGAEACGGWLVSAEGQLRWIN